MKVKELINKLKEFPQDLEVYDICMDKVEEIKLVHWIDPNYPYKDEDDRIVIE